MKESILRLHFEGKSYNEIRAILGCSKGTISYHCGVEQKDKSRKRKRKNRKARRGINNRRKKIEVKEEILILRSEGKTYPEIEKILKCSQGRIGYWIKKEKGITPSDICENCNRKHDGNYGSGRFCSHKCAHVRKGGGNGNAIKCRKNKIEKELTRLNTIHICENCNNQHSGNYGSGRFCSSKCARGFSTKENRKNINDAVSEAMTGRKHSEERKLKISPLFVYYWKGKKKNDENRKTKIKRGRGYKRKLNPKSSKDLAGLIKLDKKCRYCNEAGSVLYHGSVCKKCKSEFYILYREACRFKFNVYHYPEYFDLSLIEKHKWYKAKNRGDNLGGVSRDHLYSVSDGFKNKINPEIISHPANCELLIHTDNQKKHSKSKITLGELMKRMKIWSDSQTVRRTSAKGDKSVQL